MTLLSIILLNSIGGTIVVGGILRLLAHGINHDRQEAHVARPLSEPELIRLAA